MQLSTDEPTHITAASLKNPGERGGKRQTSACTYSPDGLSLLRSALAVALRSPDNKLAGAKRAALAANNDIDVEPKTDDMRGYKGQPHALYPLHGS